ncbi:MAG: hypothetical protein AAGB26_09685, partial [Planctomycetota bacterium]
MDAIYEDSIDEQTMGTVILRAVPYAVAAIMIVYLAMGVMRATQPEGKADYHFDKLGKVPVSEDGRIKPLDSVARNALLQVSGKQSLKDDMLLPSEKNEVPRAILVARNVLLQVSGKHLLKEGMLLPPIGDGAERPAILWVAELISGRPESRDRKVLRIDDPGVLGLIGKTPEDGKFYSLNDLMVPIGEKQQPAYIEIDRLAREAQNKRDDLRTKFEDHVIGLRRQIAVMIELQTMTTPFVVPPVEQGDEWAPIVEDPNGRFSEAARDREAGKTWLTMMNALRDDKP